MHTQPPTPDSLCLSMQWGHYNLCSRAVGRGPQLLLGAQPQRLLPVMFLRCAALEGRVTWSVISHQKQKDWKSFFTAWMENFTNVPLPEKSNQEISTAGLNLLSTKRATGRPGLLWKMAGYADNWSQAKCSCGWSHWSWRIYLTSFLFFNTLSVFLEKFIHQSHH